MMATHRATSTRLDRTNKPACRVQYHPEASPGPMDSFYLFERFVGTMG